MAVLPIFKTFAQRLFSAFCKAALCAVNEFKIKP
jgi:hypothetical protein